MRIIWASEPDALLLLEVPELVAPLLMEPGGLATGATWTISEDGVIGLAWTTVALAHRWGYQ